MKFLEGVAVAVQNVSVSDLNRLDAEELQAFESKLDSVNDEIEPTLARIDALMKWCIHKRKEVIDLRGSIKLLRKHLNTIEDKGGEV